MSVQEGGESDDTTSASALSVGGQYGPDSLDNAVSPWKGRTGARTSFYSRSLDLRDASFKHPCSRSHVLRWQLFFCFMTSIRSGQRCSHARARAHTHSQANPKMSDRQEDAVEEKPGRITLILSRGSNFCVFLTSQYNRHRKKPKTNRHVSCFPTSCPVHVLTDQLTQRLLSSAGIHLLHICLMIILLTFLA